MKVQELINKMNTNSFDLNKEVKVKTYLPMETKKIIAQGIIFECTEESEGAIKINSLQRYMSYVKYMIQMHTDIEYDETQDYDLLCSTLYEDTNLLNAIMELFADDARECSRVLDLMTDDLMRENSTEITTAKFMYNLNQVVNEISKKINDFDIKSVLPDGLDTKALNEFMNKYME